MNFVGVAWVGDDASFQGFVDEHSITFPTISDDPGDVYFRFGVPSQPALVVLDSAGSAQQMFGAVEPELLRSILDNLLAG